MQGRLLQHRYRRDRRQTALQERAERLAETTFVGGPVQLFDAVGRMQLETLLHEGLNADSRVLDVGCGCLRAGYWLKHFLDEGCYFGIELNEAMLHAGLDHILEPGLAERAKPRFAHCDDFDLGVFETAFDFVLTRSVWTHASKEQIRQMLDGFVTWSTPEGVLLSSYSPSDRVHGLPAWVPGLALRLPSGSGYEGEAWIGRSHRSTQPGVVRHSFRWMVEECRKRGLTVRQLDYAVINGQWWLRIERNSAG